MKAEATKEKINAATEFISVKATPANPQHFEFLLDISSSMGDCIPKYGKSKAAILADTMNSCLRTLVGICEFQGKARKNSFTFGIKTFGDTAQSLLPQRVVGVNDFEALAKLKDVATPSPDGKGMTTKKLACWIEPMANGGTDLLGGLRLSREDLTNNADQNPNGPAQRLIVVTDGEQTVGTNEEVLEEFTGTKSIRTRGGNVIVCIIFVSSNSADEEMAFSITGKNVSPAARMMYQASSPLNDETRSSLEAMGMTVPTDGRCFFGNSSPKQLDFGVKLGSNTLPRTKAAAR